MCAQPQVSHTCQGARAPYLSSRLPTRVVRKFFFHALHPLVSPRTSVLRQERTRGGQWGRGRGRSRFCRASLHPFHWCAPEKKKTQGEGGLGEEIITLSGPFWAYRPYPLRAPILGTDQSPTRAVAWMGARGWQGENHHHHHHHHHHSSSSSSFVGRHPGQAPLSEIFFLTGLGLSRRGNFVHFSQVFFER